MSDFFDDVLGFDPNGGGIHDTFIGDILDNPVVNTVLKFTPAAPLAFAWDAASAAGSGDWARAGLNAFGAYGTMPGLQTGVSKSQMLADQYAGFDAADVASHAAGAGLSASDITSVLGNMGIDYNTAEALANQQGNLNAGSSFTQTRPLDQAAFGDYSQGFNIEGTSLDGTPITGQVPDMSGSMSTGTPLANETANSLGDMWNTSSLEGVDITGTPPVQLEGGRNWVNPNPTPDPSLPTALKDLGSGVVDNIKGLWNQGKDTFGLSKIDDKQLLSSLYQTYQDYQDAQKLDKLAYQAGQPYRDYQETFTNPYKYWDQYMGGQGAETMNTAARQMAKGGRTGMLPALWTQARKDYMSSYLPQVRQGLQQGASMADMNMMNQQYGMKMRNNARSYLPKLWAGSK